MNTNDLPKSLSSTTSPSPSTALPPQRNVEVVAPPPPSAAGPPPLAARPPPSAAEPPQSSQQQRQLNDMIPAKDPDAIFSGGGISGTQNAKFNYGYASFKGKRSSMEDFFETQISEVDGQMVAFFGVFDGHGGSRTAEYLKNNLFKNLSSHPDFMKDTKSAIVEAFMQTDTDYLRGEKAQQKDAGSF